MQPTIIPQLPLTQSPENYLAIMAAEITIPEKRELEEPGIFQCIINEMLKANNFPKVKFPEIVIKSTDVELREEERETRKRSKSSEERGEGEIVEEQTAMQTKQEISGENAIIPDGTRRNTKYITPTTTPVPTPATTPLPTPSSSPQCQTGKVVKKPKQQKRN